MNALIISQYSDRIHGIPRYATELAQRLEDSTLIRYNASKEEQPEKIYEIYRDIPKTPMSVAIGKFVKNPIYLSQTDADVYHAVDPRETLPIGIARVQPIVTTLHDLIVYEFPQTFKRRWTYLSRFYLQWLNSSDRIIAVSNSTKQDAIKRLGIPSEKIDVVYHGVDDRFKPLTPDQLNLNLEQNSVLMVGSPQPRKNHTGVATALGKLNDNGMDTHLYVVGASESDIEPLSNDTPLDADYIHPTGYISDKSLIEYYNAADVVAVPSYYEGFGFPVLEAMACGSPVVTSDRSSLPEIAGDAAIIVNPDDSNSIAGGIKSILTDDKQSSALRRAGLERAESFTWERTARETRQVYQRAIERSE